MKWSLGSYTVEEFLLSRGPSSSAEVRGLVIHDIKEVEGVRQQEEQEDKRDEEIRDEVNGEAIPCTHSPFLGGGEMRVVSSSSIKLQKLYSTVRS